MDRMATGYVKPDDIYSFYIASFLYGMSGDAFHKQLLDEYADKALAIFRHALDWELKKSSLEIKPTQDFTDSYILEYIRNFPESSHKRTMFLGPRWEQAAKILLCCEDKNQAVDTLVCMQHNHGHILSRVLKAADFGKLQEFLTVKFYAHDIRELLLYSDDSFLIKEGLKVAKAFDGKTQSTFEKEYHNMIEERHAKIKYKDHVKKVDLENIERLLAQCEEIGASAVLNMIRHNMYAWSGRITDGNEVGEVIYCSTIVSGKFEECLIKESHIEGGLFRNCAFTEGCNLFNNSVFIDCVFEGGAIPPNSTSTFENCRFNETVCTSDKVSMVDSEGCIFEAIN